MTNVNELPSLDFEAGSLGAHKCEPTVGAIIILVGIITGN